MRGGEDKTSYFSVLNNIIRGHNSIDNISEPMIKEQKLILKLKFAIFYAISLFFAAIFWRSAEAGTEVVNVISIGAGLMSIGLAFGAMIYAYSQAQIATEQNSQVQSSLQQIRDHVVTFSTIREEFGSFRSDFSLAVSQINTYNQEILKHHEQIKETVCSLHDIKSKLQSEGREDIAKELGDKLAQFIQKTEELKEKTVDANETLDSSFVFANFDKLKKRRRITPVFVEVTSKKIMCEEEILEVIYQVADRFKVKPPSVRFELKNGNLFAVFNISEKYPTDFFKILAQALSDDEDKSH